MGGPGRRAAAKPEAGPRAARANFECSSGRHLSFLCGSLRTVALCWKGRRGPGLIFAIVWREKHAIKRQAGNEVAEVGRSFGVLSSSLSV